ncbi:MAG: MgtC/SapB family protein [Candidatus Omnitrophica bacterium]|nr:MgtC/SapB family protein [Candidatus Omnitrophota bacterium]
MGAMTAMICGTLIGLDRQVRGKPAGVRTSTLICLGTYIYVWLGMAFAGPDADPLRILGQVVTGIGFLGAGVMFNKEGGVVGVTSASVIWILAAIGAMVGMSQYSAALMVTLLVLSVLVGVDKLEKGFMELRQGVHSRSDLEVQKSGNKDQN